MTQFVRKEQEQAEEVKEYPRNFTMVKNYRGTISVFLEPFDLSAPGRLIIIKHDKQFQVVPTKWALGVFTTDGATTQLEKGYITFENFDLLIELAESEGLYVPDSIKNPKVTIKQMEKLLLKNDIENIDKLLERATKKTILDFIATAKDLKSRLNYATVTYIKNKFNVTLDDINLDG